MTASALRLQRKWTELEQAAEARAHLGERTRAINDVTELLAENIAQRDPGTLVSCANTLIVCDGRRRRKQILSILEGIESAIERTGARSYLPFLHELRARLAHVCGDDATCDRERREAERLWAAMGAHGHIERMTLELDELVAF